MKIFLLVFMLSFSCIAQDTTYNSVMQELFKIDHEDQKYRLQMEEVEQKYGVESDQMEELYRKMEEADSINLVKVEAIIDKYGWLGVDEIGSQCNTALFMVIQHSDLKTQEKYLPMLREAVKNKKARPDNLALLEDRVSLGQGKRQIYGSQIGRNPKTLKYFVLPLEDPDNVDVRRKSVGLQPLKMYVKNWDIKWDVNQYKKDLPKIEAEWRAMTGK